MVKEANISAEELKRKYNFEPTIVHEVDEKPGMSPLEELKNSKSKVKVRVTNKEDGYHYDWDPEKFSDRLYMIRDVMNEYFDSGKLPKLDKDQDPFWDPEEACLIGRGYVYLKSLGYMLDNVASCRIMNTNHQGDCGTLDCGVVPTDETGEATECPDELIVDEPHELLGKTAYINVVINGASGLPEHLAKDTYVKYSWYLDNEEIQTDVIQGKDRNPKYNHKHLITIDCISEDILKYFENDALCFKVYGTPTSAKIRKQITMQEEKKKSAPKKDSKFGKKEETKKEEPKKDTKAPTPKPAKKTEVVKMTTPDGQVVEVVKEKQGCCTIF
jgi:hypothetical protein